MPPKVDAFRWLREGPREEVLAYLEEENRYLADVLADGAPLQRQLLAEFAARLPAPEPEPEPAPAPRLSPSGALAATLELIGADERGVLRVAARAALEVEAATSFAWCSDTSLLFVIEGAARRPAQVFRASLRDGAWERELLFEERDGRFAVRVFESRCGGYALVVSESRESCEAWALPRAAPDGPLRCVKARVHGVRFEVDCDGDGLLFLTNDGAPLRRLEREREGQAPGLLVPEHPSAVLAKCLAFRRARVLLYREQGSAFLRVQRSDGSTFDVRDFGVSPPVQLALDEASDFDGDEAFVVVDSPTAPWVRCAVSLSTGGVRQEETLPVDLGGLTLQCEQRHAPGADGVEIPVTLVRAAGQAGPAPTVLSVYGAYGARLPMTFSVGQLSLLQRGVTLAFAHVRGGGELGPAWHAAGRRLRKWTTFIDLVSAAEWLVSSGVTAPAALALWGTSAGGLAAAVACRLRPALFCGVALEVPFVDVLGTMLDPSLPLTELEYGEWGDPRDPEVRRYIASYDPTLNLGGPHPHVLLLTGVKDHRVPFWGPAAWAVGLRQRGSGPGQVLLRCELEGGHGTTDASAENERLALIYAFFLQVMDVPLESAAEPATNHGRAPMTL